MRLNGYKHNIIFYSLSETLLHTCVHLANFQILTYAY